MRLLTFLVLAFGLWLIFPRGLAPALVTLALVLAAPRWRERWLALGGIFAAYWYFSAKPYKQLLDAFPALAETWAGARPFAFSATLAAMVFCASLGQAARWPMFGWLRRYGLFVALSALFIGLACMPGFANYGAATAWAYVFLFTLALNVWYLAYDLASGDFPGRAPAWFRLAYYRPIWAFTFIAPIPRGESSFKALSAASEEKLALTRRSAVRLALWAIFLFAAHELARPFIFRENAPWAPFSLGIPTAPEALAEIGAGSRFGLLASWRIALAEFLFELLRVSYLGHLIVAYVRALGVASPRNTYRPFAATSLIDFFNRYNYFMKELFLNIFYYRAFFSRALAPLANFPRARVAVAVLLSAGLGNFIVHLCLRIDDFLRMGLLPGLHWFRQYALYCLVLSAALAVSQLRALTASGGGAAARGWRRFPALLGILAFYALLRLIDHPFGGDLRANLVLIAGCFGISL